MAKPAKIKVRVSTQPAVLMEAEVLRKIRQHARTSMKAEVCGVLIGNTEDDRMTVEACIAGINAAQGGAHVTFTQDTWEHIYKIKDKEFPDHKIVGWYHSHPGFGVFLSEHDLFIQQNFFSNPLQVAWVFDPHTDEEGCFGWIGGNIEKLSDIRVGYSQAVELAEPGFDEEERDDEMDEDPLAHSAYKKQPANKTGPREPGWMKWVSRVMGYTAALGLGIVLSFLFLNWLWTPVFDKANRYDLIVEQMRRYQEEQQRVLGGGGSATDPGAAANQGPAVNPGSPSQPQQQAPLQQASPLQKGPAKEGSKGTNGKH
jgi:proteasome lid subunit RPN8/RPN11